MNIKILADYLSAYNPTLLEYGFAPSIKRVKLMTAGVSANSSDLVIGRIDDFVRFGMPLRTVNILCVGDAETARPMASAAGVNCIVISGHLDIFQLYNEIIDILHSYGQLEQASDLLLASSTCNMGGQFDLTQAIDIANRLFSNPVALFSPAGNAFVFKDNNLCYPGLFENYEPGRMAFEFTKFISGNYRQNGTTPKICESFMGNEFRAIVCGISNLNDIVSYFLVFEHSAFNEADLLLASLFCSWIGEGIRKGTIELSNNNTLTSQFLIALLDTEITDEQEAVKKSKQLNMPQHRSYTLLLLDISKMSFKHGTPDSVSTMISNQSPNVYTAVYGEYSAVLIIADKTGCEEFIRKISLEKLCKTFKLNAGLSYSFSTLTGITTAFEQACAAIEIGEQLNPIEPIHEYDNYVFYHLLKSGGKGPNLRQYCHPQLLQLLEYDRKNNTEFTYTLYVLLLSGCRQMAAAKALNIHRSTMQYRIERITSLTGIELSDTLVVTRLYISFGILVLSGDLDAEKYYQL